MQADLGNLDIQKIMNSKGDVVKCIVLPCNSNVIKEVVIDTTPKAGSVQKFLGGEISFLGQYENEGTVVIVLRDQDNVMAPTNNHKLQPPLHKCSVKGDILIMKVAEEGSNGSFFLDYDVNSFTKFMEEDIEEFEVAVDAKALAQSLSITQGEDSCDESSDEECSEDEDESVEGESDSEDEDNMIAFLLSNTIEKFKSLHGREPTDDELKNIGDAIKEKFIGLNEEDKDDEEEDDDEVKEEKKRKCDVDANEQTTNKKTTTG